MSALEGAARAYLAEDARHWRTGRADGATWADEEASHAQWRASFDALAIAAVECPEASAVRDAAFAVIATHAPLHALAWKDDGTDEEIADVYETALERHDRAVDALRALTPDAPVVDLDAARRRRAVRRVG